MPIDVPPVRRYALARNGDYAVFSPRSTESVDVPDELFLRETLDTDASDSDAVVNYCAMWGPLAHLGANPLEFLPTAKYVPSKSYQEWINLVDERQEQRGEVWLPIRLLSVHLVVLQTLTSHWLHYSTGGEHSDLPAIWDRSPVKPGTAAQAWRSFFTHLDHALQHQSVHLSSPDIDWEAPQINTYMANCLQIYNHAAVSATYQRCLSETCGRFFYTQRGRAGAGQYRTRGVLYCSSSCARAQAQRKYRRRKLREAGGS